MAAVAAGWSEYFSALASSLLLPPLVILLPLLLLLSSLTQLLSGTLQVSAHCCCFRYYRLTL